MKHTATVVGAVVLAATLLVGCGSVTSYNGNNTITNANGTNASTSNTNASNASGSNTSNQVPSNETAAANNTANAATGANSTTNSIPVSSTTNSEGAASSNSASAEALVRQSMQLAKQGKAVGIPFAVQQNIDAVQNAWGNADSQTSAGAGIYETYGSRATAFGMNKGEQIFDVRSYSSHFHAITLSDIEAVLGTPGDIRHTSDSDIYMYPAGPDYQLLWVFSKSSSGAVDNTVDHVSVFWPQGTINIMAATQPAPSIAIDNAPGTVGSLFTFSIQHPPKGYRLVELEWLPTSGAAVVNTYSQAVSNGESGGSNPGFNISPDGQTTGFTYPSSMSGQTGTVRVIYQATSGEAMIGNSSTITLK